MAFTVDEFRDLLRLLEERPEWRAKLRRAILTEEFLTLPELVRSLAEALQCSEARLGRVEVYLSALAEAQQHTEIQMAALAEAQRRTETRLDTMSLDLAGLKGDSLERRFREHGPAYFSRLVRRSRVLTAAEVMDVLEPIVAHGALSALEAGEVTLADLIIALLGTAQ